MKESCFKGCFCSKVGFTLIELLVVVLIIGILAAVAVPQYQKAVAKSRLIKIKVLATALVRAQEVYYLTNGKYTLDIKSLDIDFSEEYQCDNNDSPRKCTFKGGYCSFNGSSVTCVINQNSKPYLRYEQWFASLKSSARLRVCRTYTKDLSAVPNQVCKAETKRSSPNATGTENGVDYASWYY